MTFDIQPPGPEHAGQDAAGLRRSALRAAIGERLLVADGAMGSMLQGCPTTLDDFAGHEGGNEILNVTRPDIVRSIHDGYLEAGVDCLTTNTFGANLVEGRAKVMRLLQPERTGVSLSEEFQLAPEQSTDALIAHHPEANYFST
jgi:S-methylmethionine-dependent homocysteine/selenocysteine methylase